MTDSGRPHAKAQESATTAMRVRVGVALYRPPAVHEWRKVIVAARDETEAQLIACQISACTAVMPVVSWIDRGKD